MGRAPCCDKTKVKRGPWSPEEDNTLKSYVQKHGTGGNWIALPQKAGLKRCGKSCRLRWLNYLRPDIKHGGFTQEEDQIILALYSNIGSRWSVIASHLPGRTDNDVKNYWNTKLKKKLWAATNNSNVFTHSVPVNFNDPTNYNYDSVQQFVGPQSTQFPLPSLTEIHENCTNNNNYYNQQVSNACNTSSPFGGYDESNFGTTTSWFGNAGFEEDVFHPMDMTSSSSPSSSSPLSCFDPFINYGFDFQEKFAAAPNFTHPQPSNGFDY